MKPYTTEPEYRTVAVYWGYNILELSTDETDIILQALDMYKRAMREEEKTWGHYEDGVNPAGQEANATQTLIEEIENQLENQ